jgi:predicted metal-binding membrane protein
MSWIASSDSLAGNGRERRIVVLALVLLTALAWLYLWLAPMPMPATHGGLHAPFYITMTFAMWLVMMVGMMTPAAAPVVMLFDRIERSVAGSGATVRTPLFLLGYLCVWLAFSLLATVLQVAMIGLGWIDDMAVAARGVATALVVLGIGVYQWLPLKSACLSHCHSPADFLVRHRRRGFLGAWRMGAHHGLYCLGCCWALMLLLFVVGVMNLLWVAAITALVLVERLVARPWLRHAIGALAIVAGCVLLAQAR